jgi:hypothetical protein
VAWWVLHRDQGFRSWARNMAKQGDEFMLVLQVNSTIVPHERRKAERRKSA